ncbi:MAG: hypothetical protein GY898_08540 [Proteobacteria bacterium]|nr:hypothetical protein [Pseudomonadota bacterium]
MSRASLRELTAPRRGAPVITSIGIASGIGQGREAFVQGWRTGAVGTAVDRVRLRDFYPKRRAMFRRMDRLSQLICLASALARDDQGLGDPAEVALAVGTDLGTLEGTWSFLSRLRDHGAARANPMDFPNLVPNAGAGYAGIFLGLQGPSHTFCQHETCGDEAIGWATDGIASGWFDAALAGGAEELGEVRAAATSAAACLPEELPPGEGAAMVLVESRERADARGATPLARILGSWAASTPDGRSPYVFDVGAGPVRDLIGRALSEAGLEPGDVGAVLASPGTEHGLDAPSADHAVRLGVHPADGAVRVALGALLVADRTLPVHTGGAPLQGDAVVVVSAARGGSIRVTILGKA